ncbi:hypothetical protein CEE37_14420 [candidate division LCP-89 bacterium B3_LCP]|uniref:Uncharacterized protein n=1 Tax=candidate division LCP-89 bacterium B3_LCP TaxID=2012998 RepID=A0A532UPP0_UNCL8|nr:MAG: hypothetical protein CEE37_14420 [candidate division LCP-89 bacterium B3_LCP]
MRNREGNIEILLLLCCIVGVVAFFALSLAVTSAYIESPEESDRAITVALQLLKERSDKEAQLEEFEKLKDNIFNILERKRAEFESLHPDSESVAENREYQKQSEVSRLDAEYDFLIQQIAKLKRELEHLQDLPDPDEVINKQVEIEKLREELEKLKRDLNELNRTVSKHPVNQQQLKGKQKELDRLRDKHKRLHQEIDRLIQAILDAGVDPGSLAEKEDQLIQLKQELQDYIDLIAELSKQLSPEHGKAIGDSLQLTQSDLEEELARLKNLKAALQEEIDILRIQSRTGGGTAYQNPLYIDCQREAIITYPAGRLISSSQFAEKSFWKNLCHDYDFVVLFVRPEGVETFEAVHDGVTEITSEYCTEPLAKKQKLDFLKRSTP